MDLDLNQITQTDLVKFVENEIENTDDFKIFKILNTFYIGFSRRIDRLLYLIKTKFNKLYKRKNILINLVECYLQTIKVLNLQNLNLTANDLRYILNWNFSNLKILNLQNNLLLEVGAKFLSEANLRSLEHLNLYKNRIGDEGLSCICRSQWSPLNYLNLSGNNITSKGINELTNSTGFNNLVNLDLSFNLIGEEGARILSLCQNELKYLSSLNLSHTFLKDEGVFYITTGNFTNIRSLNLSCNEITILGAKYISESDLPHLEKLNLYGNSIGEGGGHYLTRGNYTGLKSLDLTFNKISERPNFTFYKFPNLYELYY